MRWATQWTCEVDLEDPPLFAGGWKLVGWEYTDGIGKASL